MKEKGKKSLKDFLNSSLRREFLEGQLNIKLNNISQYNFTDEQVVGKNIENLIGATQIPLGIAGPLKLRVMSQEPRTYYLPLATTEGALVASISRGCKALAESSGATVFVEDVGMTRGPVFKTTGLKHSIEVKKWIETHIFQISAISKKTSSHLKLLKVNTALVGKNLFVRFSYSTSDAMGMNMVTFATEKAVKLIEKKTKAQCISLAGNFDIDKKPAWLNFIEGRGKKVWAEVILPKKIVKEVLKTTPQKLVEVVYRKNHLGSIMSGSLGFNAHFSNILSAIFIATGQDPAHVVEGSLGVTTCEVLDSGDLYFSIFLPSLVVGTVGGGTNLPTQKEAMEVMGNPSVLEYSQIVGAAVLAGELSLLSSLSVGSLATAHQKLARKKV